MRRRFRCWERTLEFAHRDTMRHMVVAQGATIIEAFVGATEAAFVVVDLIEQVQEFLVVVSAFPHDVIFFRDVLQ